MIFYIWKWWNLEIALGIEWKTFYFPKLSNSLCVLVGFLFHRRFSLIIVISSDDWKNIIVIRIGSNPSNGKSSLEKDNNAPICFIGCYFFRKSKKSNFIAFCLLLARSLRRHALKFVISNAVEQRHKTWRKFLMHFCLTRQKKRS